MKRNENTSNNDLPAVGIAHSLRREERSGIMSKFSDCIVDKNNVKMRIKQKIRIDNNGCWNWTGAKDKRGYGFIKIGSRINKSDMTIRTHRVSLYAFKGIDPCNFDVCHKCDNPSCVNPEHLFLGTAKDNMRDMVEKGRGYSPPSTAIYCVKLSESDVKKMRQIRENSGISYEKIGEMFHVSKKTAMNAIKKKTWRRTV